MLQSPSLGERRVSEPHELLRLARDSEARGASDLRQRLFQIESIAEAEAIFLEYLEPVSAVA